MSRSERISQFVISSLQDESFDSEINFGNIPNFKAQEIAQITGITVRGSCKTMTVSSPESRSFKS